MPEDVRWLDDAELRAWQALLNTTYGLLAVLDRELQQEHDLTLAEYEVMVILSEAPEGGVRMSDLALALHLSPSGTTRRVDGMVRRGFVCRRQCPEDRRGSYARLTDEGWKRLREAAPTHVAGVRRHFVDRLSERQLVNLTAALGEAELEPGGSPSCDEARG